MIANYIVYIAAAIAFTIAVVGMSVGVLISNRRLKGTCGGLNNQSDSQGGTACQLCSNPAPECRGEQDAKRREEMASQTSG